MRLVAVLAVVACCPSTPIGNAHRAIAKYLRAEQYRVVACRQVTRLVVDCRVAVYRQAVASCQPGAFASVTSVGVCEAPEPEWVPVRLRVHRGHVWILKPS